MKRIYYIALTLIMTSLSCVKEQTVQTEKGIPAGGEVTLKADIEETKASVTDEGIFSWQTGDVIGVYDGSAFVPFTLSSGEGTASGEFTGTLGEGGAIQQAVVYPYDAATTLSGTTLSFNLPKEYNYSAQNTNSAMAAVLTSVNPGNVLLRHLSGVVKITYTNVPSGASFFRFVVREKKITGAFSLDLSAGAPEIATPEASVLSGSTVTIKNLPASGSLTFYVPLPTGNYSSFFVALYDAESAVIPGTARTARSANLAVGQAELTLGPAVVCGSGAYKTKKYGTKTWIVENCREKGADGQLGKVNDPVFASVSGVSEYVKSRIGASAGRYYTWYEAMTGISNCTAEENPFVDGYYGTDDAGNPFILDGTEAGEYNIQIKGCCPDGYHIANANDWWDLFHAIKGEYSVPDDYVICGYTFSGGPISSTPLTKQLLYNSGAAFNDTGNVAAWLRGGNGRIIDGGVWNQANLQLPAGPAPQRYFNQFTDGADSVGFGWFPTSRFNKDEGTFNTGGLGKYSFLWTPARQTNALYAKPYIMSGTSMTFLTANTIRDEAKKTSRLNVRCVKNY